MALAVASELGFDTGAIAWEKSIYEARVDDLLAALAEHDTGEMTRMIVGHNPGLADLVTWLTRPETLPAVDKCLPTAGVYVLDIGPEAGLKASRAICIGHMRPRWLA